MSVPVPGERQRKLARVAAAAMANKDTPLIRNAWYVAARSDEISRRLMSRQVLGRSVLLFRREDGTPVALQNRCCHRSFPLEHGKLDGDVIQCGYHGFRYDCTGKCIAVPSQQQPPENVRLRRYRAVERTPFVWIWAGEFDAADENLLPHPEWLGSPDWDLYIGYLNIKGSYVHMHENLLDLSHLSFLHETTFGTPEYARAPVELTVAEPNFEVWRHVECVLPGIYSRPLGWEGQKALRSSGAQYVSPGLHVNTGFLKNLTLPVEQQQPQPTIKVAQLITPETQHATHYYFAACRNFARKDPDIDAFMLKAQTMAFSEDLFAMEQIARMQALESREDYYEIDVAADRAGVAMRRYLKKLADAEAAPIA